MLFSGSVFLFFFLPLVLIVYYGFLHRWRNGQNVWLLISSLFFYAWGEPWFVLIMIASIMVNWGLALAVDFRKRKEKSAKPLLFVTVFINLIILFVFKYLMFALGIVNSVFNTDISIPLITLPIGISFFTFQAMSYVFDVYRDHGEVQKNPLNVGLYISFFPQLIAGPIVRYETVAHEIKHRKETLDDFTQGICRFIIGLGKKVLLSNQLALCADAAFLAERPSVAFSWLGAIAYALQIYYDFSGYSDMAIGLGRMFGFHFLENFDYPYISKSVSEFWRRWHISLGTYFRDYVYFPLGGSRVKTKGRLIFNLFVVWSLTGIWHGAAWTFVLWGLYYFILIVLEKLTGWNEKLQKAPFLAHAITLILVLFGWVLFRAPDVTTALNYIGSMFGSGGVLWNDTAALWLRESAWCLAAGLLFAFPIAKKASSSKGIFSVLYPIALIVVFILSVSYLVKGGYNPFIYFNF